MLTFLHAKKHVIIVKAYKSTSSFSDVSPPAVTMVTTSVWGGGRGFLSVRKITRTHTNECKYYSRTIILWLTFCISFLFVNFFLNFSVSQFFYFCFFFVLRLNCQYLPKCKLKQECIPVVCVPPARWLYPVVSNGGGGESANLPNADPLDTDPLVDRMTDTCENITFPQTSFAGGKDMFLVALYLIKEFLVLLRWSLSSASSSDG